MVALIGLPGSGKTRLAGYLAGRHGFELIDRDALRAELFPECRYTEDEKRAANAAVLERLRRNCASGASSVIDDMTFGRRSERTAAQAVAVERGFRFIGLWLDCPVDLAMARVAAQAHPAGDRSPELAREVAARFEPPQDALRIDAALPPEEIQRIVAAILAAG